MALLTYKEQLRDVRWQMKRNKILDRDKHICQNKNCQHRNNTQVLMEVHHLDYIDGTIAWDYPDDMLLTLCSICHESEQLRPKEEKYLINTLRMKGFLVSDLLSLSCKIDMSATFTQNLLNILREMQNG